MAHDTTWAGVGRGMLVLAALWSVWTSYAWLTNTVNPDEAVVQVSVVAAMCAMFVAALAVPAAFGAHGVVFGFAFMIVRVMHIALYALAGRGDPDLLGAVSRFAPTVLLAGLLIIAAGFVDGTLKPVLWLCALAIDYFAPLVSGSTGWRVEPGHFVERHALIIIIALGESLFALGVGAAGAGLDAGVITTAVLGLIVATAFWLAYFDFFTIRAEQVLVDRTGPRRVALARDVFSYLHLPMVAGIVLFALGLEMTAAHVGDELATIPAFGLCVGSALFIASFAAIRLRTVGTLSRGRAVTATGFVLLLPVAVNVPAVVALILVTGVWLALHAYELIWWREARAEARASRAPAPASP
jgi:low temperature requirement protein LtrA